jgi:hypothetical protein
MNLRLARRVLLDEMMVPTTRDTPKLLSIRKDEKKVSRMTVDYVCIGFRSTVDSTMAGALGRFQISVDVWDHFQPDGRPMAHHAGSLRPSTHSRALLAIDDIQPPPWNARNTRDIGGSFDTPGSHTITGSHIIFHPLCKRIGCSDGAMC